MLDLAGDTLARVDRPAFFSKFSQADAVQYFYEPFLEAFDPQLRKDLGVCYTPARSSATWSSASTTSAHRAHCYHTTLAI